MLPHKEPVRCRQAGREPSEGAGCVRIVVCVRHVYQLCGEVEFREDGRELDVACLEGAANEWDIFATEEALRLRESSRSGEVVVVTCGGREAEAVLRRFLAMGADRAIRLEGGEGDPLSVAWALADVVRAESPDLVFCGAQSSDSMHAATGVMLAELVNLPRVAIVRRVEYDYEAGRAVVDRELEGGLVERVEVDTPAVLTIQTGINRPRYANLRAIKQAERTPIDVRSAARPAAPAYRVRCMFHPSRGEGAEILGGDAREVARRIAEIVKERIG